MIKKMFKLISNAKNNDFFYIIVHKTCNPSWKIVKYFNLLNVNFSYNFIQISFWGKIWNSWTSLVWVEYLRFHVCLDGSSSISKKFKMKLKYLVFHWIQDNSKQLGQNWIGFHCFPRL